MYSQANKNNWTSRQHYRVRIPAVSAEDQRLFQLNSCETNGQCNCLQCASFPRPAECPLNQRNSTHLNALIQADLEHRLNIVLQRSPIATHLISYYTIRLQALHAELLA